MIALPLSGSTLDLLSREETVRDAIARGQFHIMSLAPVRTALAERWSRNEGLVEDFVVRSFRRLADADDVIVRVNDADFVLIQPSRSSMSALSLAAALTRQTLSHFLGEVRPENIEISVITQVDAGGIEAHRVTQQQLDAAERAETAAEPDENESPPWEVFGVARPPRKIVTFKRPECGDLESLYYCEPIWNAARGVVVAFQLRTMTFYQPEPNVRELVSPGDLTARTHAVIAQRALRYAREVLEQPENRRIALSVPIALDAFAHSASRIAIAGELKAIGDDSLRRRLFIELNDIPRDVSVARVEEAVAQIKAFARRVTVRLPALAANYIDWERTGADGLVVCLDSWLADGRVQSRLANLVRYTRRAGQFAAVDGAREPHMAVLAQSAGVAEVSGELIAQTFGETLEPRAFHLEDLFARVGQGAAPAAMMAANAATPRVGQGLAG